MNALDPGRSCQRLRGAEPAVFEFHEAAHGDKLDGGPFPAGLGDILQGRNLEGIARVQQRWLDQDGVESAGCTRRIGSWAAIA